MSVKLLANKLNDFFIEHFEDTNLKSVTFYCGNLISELARVSAKITPFAKVLLITDNSQIDYLELLTQNLKGQGLRPINLFINSLDGCSLDKIKKALPEDLRLIITPFSTLRQNAKRIAKELNLPVVIGLERLPFDIESAFLEVETHFVLDENLKIDRAKEYSTCIGKIISLLDMRLNGYLKTFLVQEQFLDEFSALLEKVFTIDINSHLVGSELAFLRIAMQMLEVLVNFSPINLTHFQSLNLLKLLAEDGKEEMQTIPQNIYLLAKESKTFTDKSYLQILLDNKKALQVYRENKAVLPSIKKGLGAQASAFYKHKSKINLTYIALGGKPISNAKRTLAQLKKLSGLGQINVLSFLVNQNKL